MPILLRGGGQSWNGPTVMDVSLRFRFETCLTSIGAISSRTSIHTCAFLKDAVDRTSSISHFDEWISHMKWQHTLVWSCQAPRHTHLKFGTSVECEAHMRLEHIQEISSAQVALLVEKSAQPAADPLEVLLRVGEAGPQARSVCPLCPSAVENIRVPDPKALVPDASTPIDGMKQMRDHIAAYLESIALLSLPERAELDNAASDEVQSESAARSSHGTDQDQESLPPTSDAWHEYNAARWTEESAFGTTEYAQDIVSTNEKEDWTFVM